MDIAQNLLQPFTVEAVHWRKESSQMFCYMTGSGPKQARPKCHHRPRGRGSTYGGWWSMRLWTTPMLPCAPKFCGIESRRQEITYSEVTSPVPKHDIWMDKLTIWQDFHSLACIKVTMVRSAMKMSLLHLCHNQSTKIVSQTHPKRNFRNSHNSQIFKRCRSVGFHHITV